MRRLVNELKQFQTYISVVGLGYVGLPVAIAFSKYFKVIGFDINSEKIEQYKLGNDLTNEVGSQALLNSSVEFTANAKDLKKSKFHIIAVPTPINQDKTPNLKPLITATKIVGEQLKKGSVVVFESTVFPGLTEEICVPILEEKSGLIFGTDFKVGYSPERINPGDKLHRLETVTKIVSGSDAEALAIVAEIYGLIITAGVHKTTSIKVAEAAKIIENTQRDINIAFMNELSIIFHRMNIDTNEVLAAARTKWNFLDFRPGLVGGHCIGIDPYYLTYRSEQLGYHPEIILAGRKINDEVGTKIAQEIVKSLVKKQRKMCDVKVGIFGITFKPNCPDIRNTKVIDIVNELREYTIDPYVYDPEVSKEEVKKNYNILFVDESEMKDLDVLILAVDHEIFKKKDFNYWIDKTTDVKIIFDIKGVLNKEKMLGAGVEYWRL